MTLSRRLDHLPPWLALAVGLIGGALLGGGLALAAPLPLAAAGFLLLLAGAAVLAYSGEPVSELVEVAPEPPPEPPPPEPEPAAPQAFDPLWPWPRSPPGTY